MERGPQESRRPAQRHRLQALYDRAFDRGYLTFDDDLRVVLSPLLRVDRPSDLHAATVGVQPSGCVEFRLGVERLRQAA